MRQTEKGVVLILTLVVTFLLLSFAVGITIVATNSYRLTTIYERNNRLKLVAESGRERGEVALKDYIQGHADTVFNHPDSFNPSDAAPSGISFTEGNVTCNVTILHDDMTAAQNELGRDNQNFTTYVIPSSTATNLPRKYPDRATNRNIDYILIRSQAENDKTHEKKVLDTYIDKKDISNVYFDRLFNSSLTVVPSNKTITPVQHTPAFSVDNHTTLNLAGTIFLQGDTVNIKPNLPVSGGLLMDEADIYVKTKPGGLNTPPSPGVLRPVSASGNNPKLYKSPSTANTELEWKNTLIRGLDMLELEAAPATPILNSADTLQKIKYTALPTSSDVDEKFIHPYPPTGVPTLITYKVQQDVGSTPVNFRKIIDGYNEDFLATGLYYEICKKLQTSLAGTPIDYLKVYGKVYKLIIVDGDLIIPDNPDEEINNYIIYCTGHVSFTGSAKFYNCSIFANSITFDETASSTVTFEGVNTHLARMHSSYNILSPDDLKLSDFSQANKGVINTYLTNNIINYADFIKFKSIDWREY